MDKTETWYPFIHSIEVLKKAVIELKLEQGLRNSIQTSHKESKNRVTWATTIASQSLRWREVILSPGILMLDMVFLSPMLNVSLYRHVA